MPLTKDLIRQRTNGNSFSRGESYYRSGAILNTVKRGQTLEGYCEGSEVRPYHVKATVTDTAIIFATCTCPYDFGGDCKHIVALLLTYLNNPEQFIETALIEQTLQERSKEELVSLITKMVEKYPDLQYLVDRPIPSARKTELDLDSFRREMNHALRDFGEWGDTTATDTVYSIASTADEFAKAGDLKNASRIYRVIVEEFVPVDQYPVHDEGEFGVAYNDMLFDLAHCLDDPTFADDTAERQAILHALLDSYIWDIDEGGVGIGDEVLPLVMSYIRQEDIPVIRTKIEAAQQSKKQSSYPDWGVKAYASFLMELDTLENIDPETTLARLREQELYSLLFDKLLELGRSKEAIQVVEEHLDIPHERMRAIQQLAEVGHMEEAIRLAEATLDKQDDYRTIGWLIEKYSETGQHQKRLMLEKKKMLDNPTPANYDALAEVAQKLDQWETTRQEIFEQLEKLNKLGELTRLYLHERNWIAAWATVDKIQANPPKQRGWWGTGDQLAMEVARASKEAMPARAIPVYMQAVHQNINLRNRARYKDAIQLLEVVQDLCKRLDDESRWEQTIADIRAQYPTLRALHDELNKAGL